MKTSEHGGYIYTDKIKYDFSANLNPLGMPSGVKEALRGAVDAFENYPDPFCGRLLSALSEYEDFPEEKIVCGNGAADLIYRLAEAVKPVKAVVAAPCFGEYEKALSQCGAVTKRYFLSEKNDFLLDDGILDVLDSSTDMLFLCSPNNPTGRIIKKELMIKISEKCLLENIVFVCDECFLPFVQKSREKSVRNFMNERVVVLNAFTKIFSMAGLRLGYALFGSEELAERVRRTGQYWSVSVPAQIAGEAALKEKGFVEKTAELVEQERISLESALRSFGFKVCPSEANFILFRCGHPLDCCLLREHIAIRNCANFEGLDERYFRTAVRTREENEIFIMAVRRALGG